MTALAQRLNQIISEQKIEKLEGTDAEKEANLRQSMRESAEG